MGTQRNVMNATLDAATMLKDAGAVTASGAGTVGGQARVVNVGPALLSGVLNVDINALDLAGGDESYTILLQGSSDPSFATDVSELTRVQAGPSAIGQDSFGVGRVQKAFTNIDESGKPLSYLRVRHDIDAGAGTASVNYQAFISLNPLP